MTFWPDSLQVERVRMALAAEADDGDGAADQAVDVRRRLS